MNTKKCIYRNCGNLSTSAPKLTFFSFPLKDVAKCKLWSQMAGCEDVNLKHQYLCENHFNTIYVSKTPRRTVLLPNAVPYRWDENIISTNDVYGVGDTDGMLDPLLSVDDDDNDMIYTDDDQRQQIEMLDVDPIVEDDEDDENAGDELIMLEPKLQKLNATVAAAAAAPVPVSMAKIDGNDGEHGGKRLLMIQQQQQQKHPNHRIGLQSVTGEFMNHVTKRQRVNKDQLSSDQQQQQQHKICAIDLKKSIQSDDKQEYNNGTDDISGNGDDAESNLSEDDNAITTAATDDTSINDRVATPDILVDDTANNPDIATFNLKGEEFIQMPKRIYLAQRAQYNADLKRYRSIIQNIKNTVNSID